MEPMGGPSGAKGAPWEPTWHKKGEPKHCTGRCNFSSSPRDPPSALLLAQIAAQLAPNATTWHKKCPIWPLIRHRFVICGKLSGFGPWARYPCARLAKRISQLGVCRCSNTKYFTPHKLLGYACARHAHFPLSNSNVYFRVGYERGSRHILSPISPKWTRPQIGPNDHYQ